MYDTQMIRFQPSFLLLCLQQSTALSFLHRSCRCTCAQRALCTRMGMSGTVVVKGSDAQTIGLAERLHLPCVEIEPTDAHFVLEFAEHAHTHARKLCLRGSGSSSEAHLGSFFIDFTSARSTERGRSARGELLTSAQASRFQYCTYIAQHRSCARTWPPTSSRVRHDCRPGP
jgi:hypothetical protein